MDNKRVALLGGGVVFVLALLAAVVWVGFSSDNGEDAKARPGMSAGDPASQAADAFALAWEEGRLGDVPATEDSGAIDEQALKATVGLGGSAGLAPGSVEVTSLEEVETDDGEPDRVSADLTVTWDLDPDRTWTYDAEVDLVRQEGSEGQDDIWAVDWAPTVVHPVLAEGDTLQVARAAARRGELLGPDGETLVGVRNLVRVGVEPGRADDPEDSARQVAALVGVDAEALVDRVLAAGPADFVDVITVRAAVFDAQRADLEAIDGTAFRDEQESVDQSRTFARALLGTNGPASQEVALASEGQIQTGDVIGLSGLQAAQDEVLRGRPSLSIRALPAGAGQPTVLKDIPAVPGETLTLTLDPTIQSVADDVMALAPQPAALVAIRPSTGDVLAVANGPSGADGYNRALIGRYPPGSTFKVASGYTYLENGLTPDTIVDCPATIVVGKEFKNAGGEVLGEVSFRRDFAESCNTVFVDQSREVTSQQLADAAARLGFRDLDIGVPLVLGSVPVTDSVTEHAANVLGQGRVEASPFTVALMSASAAAGRTVEPRLIVDPDNPEPVPGEPLQPEAALYLQEVMREVVVNGTGSAVNGIPGGPVSGKTGTAEFGTEDPPETHAWFTGYQDDIAFAVLVEGGGYGGSVAAPLVAEFLSRLAQ